MRLCAFVSYVLLFTLSSPVSSFKLPFPSQTTTEKHLFVSQHTCVFSEFINLCCTMSVYKYKCVRKYVNRCFLCDKYKIYVQFCKIKCVLCSSIYTFRHLYLLKCHKISLWFIYMYVSVSLSLFLTLSLFLYNKIHFPSDSN